MKETCSPIASSSVRFGDRSMAKRQITSESIYGTCGRRSKLIHLIRAIFSRNLEWGMSFMQLPPCPLSKGTQTLQTTDEYVEAASRLPCFPVHESETL